ncbi:hypothetical protein TorRG33x02_153030 [Trema orientale]|uniref:DUF4220 domain-containing protein n=1 Tax=Trema orientale TaxID=63057 RepID=A0A2P5ETP6_TREOI|nr:hypothetical protein TorRG33x02_153030 [Trema orientale]
MTQIIPKSFRKAWSESEIRVAVLVSLILQSILIMKGDRRKYSTNIWIRFIVWLAYLFADWVATLSIGALSNLQGDESDATSASQSYIITSFWAPFLLLHLGGPDTITAYSFEDNELWWRNFVVLSGQVGVAFYIFLNAWSNNRLNFLSVPILVAGIIKFGERIWVLMCASSEHFRKSMLPSPDPGPNYARYMDEYESRKAEGFKVSSERIIEAPTVGHTHHNYLYNVIPKNDSNNLQDAYYYFEIFKCLFADLILSIHDIVNSQSFFQERSYKEAFRVIEIELGFMYDMFYTKAVVIYSVVGGFLRFFSFSCVICVSLAFLITDKQDYTGADIVITYILLAGAIILEIYAVVLLLFSDWTMLWLIKHKNRSVVHLLYQAITSISPSKEKSKRWSNTIGQFNLIRLCLKDKPANRCRFYHKVISTYDHLLFRFRHGKLSIPDELKELIFQQLLMKSRSTADLSAGRESCDHRGEWVLKNEKCDHILKWIISREFDQTILLWHIATDLCYDHDLNGNSYATSKPKENSPQSRSLWLSEYMMYILVMRPFMLPNGIGQIRFQDTCAEAIEFFHGKKSIANADKARGGLRRVSTEIPPSEVKGDRSKSVLFDACGLAKALQSLETEHNWNREKKWELISHVWLEILSYAASQCQRNQHAQQLRRGGELLTHVWLLMAHLGITKQFQITDGHASVGFKTIFAAEDWPKNIQKFSQNN